MHEGGVCSVQLGSSDSLRSLKDHLVFLAMANVLPNIYFDIDC